jgi:hypothetical protein
MLIRQSRFVLAVAAMVGAAVTTGVAATLGSETLAAWDAYVAATEARIERELRSTAGFLVQDFTPSAASARNQVLTGGVLVSEMQTTAGGRDITVAGGTIQHWRGSIFLPGVTRDGLLARLQNPSESGPHQEDVLALRVLNRRPDALKLFIRMTRRKIVTVTYDTEHQVTYRRHGSTRASSRSVATKIAEIDAAGTPDERARPVGDDRGFLWRLNSYWRYEQVNGGVIVELESLTLSRAVPLGLGYIVDPIIDRVARESVTRTLQSLKREL